MWKRLSILSSLIWSCFNNHAAHTCAHSLWRRQIGDKIDTHIPWARKHFFASTTVLRVIVCFLLGFVSLFLFIVLFSSGHRWPYFVSWNFSFVISFSSRRRSGLVLSLRHFHVHASSVLRFVDCATCKTPIRQLFPPSLHQAHTGQNNTAKKVTEVVSVLKDALAKIENKSEEQQPSTSKGGFRGWPRGPWRPLFLWNFVWFK